MSATQRFRSAALFAAIAFVPNVLTHGLPPATIGAWSATLLALMVLGAALGACSRAMPLGFVDRTAVLLILITGVAVINVGVEAVLFMTDRPFTIARFLVSGLSRSLVVAGAAAWLFAPPMRPVARIDEPKAEIEAQAAQRQWLIAALRPTSFVRCVISIVLGGLVYALLYLVAGAIAFQFTGPYYTDPAYGLSLTVPPLYVVLLAQIIRGPLFGLFLWPFVATANTSRAHTATLAALALFVIGGFEPLGGLSRMAGAAAGLPHDRDLFPERASRIRAGVAALEGAEYRDAS